MESVMKIKYTGLYEKIQICLIQYSYFKQFVRNEWTETPDKIAEILLKEEYFLSEEDLKFITPIDNLPQETKIVEETKIEFQDLRYKLGIIRFGALGDLIMLLPVARHLKKLYNFNITLITQDRFVATMKRVTDAFDTVINIGLYKKSNYDKTVCLDGVLEQDHSLTNSERLIHRTKLYERFFGITVSNYDFSIPITEDEILYSEKILNVSNQ